jgi:hypothetical protein
MPDEELNRLLHVGAESISEALGSALGLAIAGTTGALIGATATPLAGYALKSLLGDIAVRQMSENEFRRVGTAASHALNGVYRRLMAGETPREDGFFQKLKDDRSPAETIFEGVLMTCRTQWEEKKVTWIANIYVNAAFSDVQPEVVNRIIILADKMTWRQIRIVALAGSYESRGLKGPSASTLGHEGTLYAFALLAELNELFQAQYRFMLGSSLNPTPLGRACFDLMSLGELPLEEMEELLPIIAHMNRGFLPSTQTAGGG